jgi:hypothetical protein
MKRYARARALFEPRLDGVVCGHIYHAVIKDQPGFRYVNCGHWVESCTAVIEDFSGALEIVTWTARVIEAQVGRPFVGAVYEPRRRSGRPRGLHSLDR